MLNIRLVGIDLGKSSFHVVGRDPSEHTQLRKKFSRAQLLRFIAQLPPCLIAFEACGGAHWLSRVCQRHGHQAKLIPPQYVKPYVKGNKNDFIDADAIAEAAGRPGMRFVQPKSEAAQVIAVCHRLREGFVTERTAVMSRIGAILLEFGLSLPQGHSAGGKSKLLGISKRGNKRLRCLFVHGARAVMSHMGKGDRPFDRWLMALCQSKPFNVACVALANKLVRIAWAVLNQQTVFKV